MSFYSLTFISSVVKIPLEIRKLKWGGGGQTHRQNGDNINYSLRKKNSLYLTFVFVELFRNTETFVGMETLAFPLVDTSIGRVSRDNNVRTLQRQITKYTLRGLQQLL